MMLQNPLWNRGFAHFEKIERSCARGAPGNVRDRA
jgi:hypothetical protein